MRSGAISGLQAHSPLKDTTLEKKNCTMKSVETWHKISWEMFWVLRVLNPSKALCVLCWLHTHFTTKSVVRILGAVGEIKTRCQTLRYPGTYLTFPKSSRFYWWLPVLESVTPFKTGRWGAWCTVKLGPLSTPECDFRAPSGGELEVAHNDDTGLCSEACCGQWYEHKEPSLCVLYKIPPRNLDSQHKHADARAYIYIYQRMKYTHVYVYETHVCLCARAHLCVSAKKTSSALWWQAPYFKQPHWFSLPLSQNV